MKARPYYGPRPASYEIRLDGRAYASTSCISRREIALSEIAYWAREGRRADLVVTELCPAPGCQGTRAIVEVYRRGRMYPDRLPCKCHADPVETVIASV